MNAAGSTALSKEEAVAAYKAVLREFIDRRPSGTRRKIALALGKHKSFVSQVTSPAYSVPLPAQHVAAIFEICHFSQEERRSFLEAYKAAHPRQGGAIPEERPQGGPQTLQIQIPAFSDPERQKEVIAAIRSVAAQILAVAADKSTE